MTFSEYLNAAYALSGLTSTKSFSSYIALLTVETFVVTSVIVGLLLKLSPPFRNYELRAVGFTIWLLLACFYFVVVTTAFLLYMLAPGMTDILRAAGTRWREVSVVLACLGLAFTPMVFLYWQATRIPSNSFRVDAVSVQPMTVGGTLPLSAEPWERLRFEYAVALGALPIALMFVVFIPLYFFAQWSSVLFGIPPDAAVQDQAYGWLRLAMFLSVMSAAMVGAYLLGFAIEAMFCRFVLRWPASEVKGIFLRSNLPRHWLKN